jgi:hypothetical protein
MQNFLHSHITSPNQTLLRKDEKVKKKNSHHFFNLWNCFGLKVKVVPGHYAMKAYGGVEV